MSSSEWLLKKSSPKATRSSTFNHCRVARCGGALKCRSNLTIGALQFGQGYGRLGTVGFQFDDPSCLNDLRQPKHAKWTLFVDEGACGSLAIASLPWDDQQRAEAVAHHGVMLRCQTRQRLKSLCHGLPIQLPPQAQRGRPATSTDRRAPPRVRWARNALW